MLHSDVVHNASLSGNINAGNFTYLGDVHNMQECMGLCCASKKCQLAYLDKVKCYGVKCYSANLCKITYGIPANDVKISLMVKNDLNRKGKFEQMSRLLAELIISLKRFVVVREFKNVCLYWLVFVKSN